MKKIIVYASRYGTSKEYAAQIASKKNYPVVPLEEHINLVNPYDEIIFIAPVYMGKIMSLEKFIKMADKWESKKITVITVGVYNPNRKSNTSILQEKIKRVVEKTNLNLQNIYHLYGNLHLEDLSFLHKTLINTLYKTAKKKSLEQLNEDEKDIIKAYEKKYSKALQRLNRYNKIYNAVST
ncbi:flavodoxin domain-containing protein [Clostridium sp. HBUAS56010]|uniref:flavodoxin domain-containing protein n=1 Tax=Clostridium sp. HBUAS56010 TaxID=2571127 RepID=UPI00163DDC87|nr:flavodoxin domain-containing protein [Clostridium sp. HBUAS56010]